MAVYTEVSLEQAQKLADQLQLGPVLALDGIQGGIENTNYFLTTGEASAPQHWVLTLFERLTHSEAPYYLHLMQHLAAHSVAVPDPVARAGGQLVHTVAGKPACVVTKLTGKSELQPSSSHCAELGGLLARMHTAGQSYERHQPNLRSLPWWNATAPSLLAFLSDAQRGLLLAELAYQNHLERTPAAKAAPRGAVHADLFRDNVMFHSGRISGVFDFYFAGTDTCVFDLAVTLNDWCIDLRTGTWDWPRLRAFLGAYQAQRPLRAAERQLLPGSLRGAALRFWISRLFDFHRPRAASLLQAHDPSHFERVLGLRSTQSGDVMAAL